MNKISYAINNGGKMELVQREHDGTVLVISTDENGSDLHPDSESFIHSGDMVMLINLYRYIKSNDIQNDFINPYGKNTEK